MHQMMTIKSAMLAGVVAMAMTTFGIGCSGGAPGNGTGLGTGQQAGTGADGANGGNDRGLAAGQQGTNGATGFNGGTGGTVDANTRYVPEQDPAKGQQIATRMWSILTAAQCWTLQGSSNNYTFSGANDYRYAGSYETTSGQIGLSSVGSFGGYDMADVTISGTEYWIGIKDAQTIALTFVHDDGALVTNWYSAAASGSYCV